ncbi:multidrug effflux MFS transporter [Acinetobacter stercoris]|uniref:Bcr/CflA family efflux transporter n=1 Tax=Acinetobacter stercoris TaxID=2126983 RepID=A0A2U3MWC5_9GAMM|nr:multidrug effflux MFS transporter [Acinetobacter stercoris]SPL69738.1 Bicyclomycin resistance protein [Acinetobacter stercoris]
MKSGTSSFGLAASLALITVLGPSAIDMYLSSLPEIATGLNTSFANVQLTLTVFLLSMGLGQLFFGPITDALGRKKPLLIGLIVFTGTSLWAAISTSIEILLFVRFIQGLSASLILVVALSTVRDLTEGAKAAQLFALLMTIEGLAPVLAPAVGGVIDSLWGWRAVFVALAIMGIIAILNSQINLSESLPNEKRFKLNLKNILVTYKHIISTKTFILPALSLSIAFFFLFAYIAGATLIYQNNFGLSSQQFGFVFGFTGIAVLIGALICSALVSRMGVTTLAFYGVILMALGASLALIAYSFGLGLIAIVASLFISMLGLGIAESTLMALAMASQKTALGSTAALLGAFQLVISSFATPLSGFMAEKGTTHWLSLLCIICLGLICLTLIVISKAPKNVPATLTH